MINVNEKISYSDGGIVSNILAKGLMNITLFCMARGTEISDHTSTKEGVIYVIEGSGTFKLGGKSIAMQPGVMIYMGKNAVHSLKAWENTSFLLVLSGR